MKRRQGRSFPGECSAFLGRAAWRLTFLLCLLILPLCTVPTVSAAEGNAVLTETEWTWEPGGVAGFAGSFALDGPDQAGAELTLEVESNDPENPGSVVFTEINGQTVKIRKRSDSITANLAGNGAENTFRGEWYPPEDVVSLNRATLRFQAEDAEGRVIASAEKTVRSTTGEEGDAVGRALNRTRQLSIILAAFGGILWVAAIARNLILRRKQN